MSTCANSEIPDEQMKRTKKEKNICSQTSRVEKKEKKKKRAFLTKQVDIIVAATRRADSPLRIRKRATRKSREKARLSLSESVYLNFKSLFITR
jgi:hypothetical protein